MCAPGELYVCALNKFVCVYNVHQFWQKGFVLIVKLILYLNKLGFHFFN